MNKDIRTLRQYAKLRKLPGLIKLGTLSQKINSDLLKLSTTAEITNNKAVENRKGIYGVEHDDSTPLGKTYNQKHVDEWIIAIDCLNAFEGKTDWRFAEMDANSSIPMHLDDPYTYRFIVMIEGEHIFYTDCQKYEKVNMSKGDVYFVNPAYRHGVENLNQTRIALLGKMKINEYNTELLRTST